MAGLIWDIPVSENWFSDKILGSEMHDVLSILCSHRVFKRRHHLERFLELSGFLPPSTSPFSEKHVEAISGWNNTKLRLEPPQRDKAGDSLDLSGINWTYMYIHLYSTWYNVCVCIYIYICISLYFHIYTELYRYPSPSLKLMGWLGVVCVV